MKGLSADIEQLQNDGGLGGLGEVVTYSDFGTASSD